MQNLPNIEKSGFRKGEYVGYGAGRVWRITHSKSAKRWTAAARHPGSPSPDLSIRPIGGSTLSELSKQLAKLPTIPTAARLPAVSPL